MSAQPDPIYLEAPVAQQLPAEDASFVGEHQQRNALFISIGIAATTAAMGAVAYYTADRLSQAMARSNESLQTLGSAIGQLVLQAETSTLDALGKAGHYLLDPRTFIGGAIMAAAIGTFCYVRRAQARRPANDSRFLND